MAAKNENKLASCVLPISRIRTIMKSSPEVCAINQDALFLITKSTEFFVEDLAQRVFSESSNKRQLEYNELAKLVDSEETLQFLQDIIPKKITYAEYQAMNNKEDSGDSSNESS